MVPYARYRVCRNGSSGMEIEVKMEVGVEVEMGVEVEEEIRVNVCSTTKGGC